MSFSCFRCQFCGIQTFSLHKYLTHLQFVYKHFADFIVSCDLNGCIATYKTVKCLRQHMRRKHPNLCGDAMQFGDNEVQINDIEDEQANYVDESSVAVSVSDDVNESLSFDQFLSGLRQHFAMFVIETGEKHAIPSSVQNEIAGEVLFLIDYVTHSYSDIIKYHLRQ